MKSDGQLYDSHRSMPPPMSEPCADTKMLFSGKDELLIVGLIVLLLTDKRPADLPLLLALVYILL